jgi:hypothetical protein
LVIYYAIMNLLRPTDSTNIRFSYETLSLPKISKKYTLDFLLEYCSENQIELLEDYTNAKMNSTIKIQSKCKTENCGDSSIKRIRYLIENGSYCSKCSIENGKARSKATCLARYGSEHAFQCETVKERIKKSCLEKYGVEHPSSLSEIREKAAQTNMQLYGVRNVFQSETHKAKIRETNIAKYGVPCASSTQEVQNKMKNTNLERYGVECSLQSETVQQKIRETNLEKYGTTNPRQHNKAVRQKAEATNLAKYGSENAFGSDQIKQQIRNTNMIKYGVEYPNQNADIMDKTSKNAYKVKEYVFPSGKVVKTQGYEYLALNDLLNTEHIPEEDIVVGAKNVPHIWYNDLLGKRHRHYVDIFIPSQNRCIEIKSTWTAEKKQYNIFRKQAAAKERGFAYEIWIYNIRHEKENVYH